MTQAKHTGRYGGHASSKEMAECLTCYKDVFEKPKAKQTVTPWAINDYKDCIYQGDYVIAEKPHGKIHDWEANAAFIVRVVNSHETLVTALKRISTGEFAANVSSEECLLAMRQVAREALKQAEGK